jgi:phosphomannomutase
MTSLQTLITEVSLWADQDPESDYRDMSLHLLERLRAGDESALIAARELFGSRLAFGTAGIRGPMRGGPNGMNRLVISQTTAGIAHYLLEKSPSDETTQRVVIGFDGRHHSETFARDTAEVVSGHGISAILLPRMLPTPVLAFAVREVGATAGVMITASHNPAEDNGYKLYFGGQDKGSQIIAPVDANIEAHIQKVAASEIWSSIPRSTDLVAVIDGDIVEKYLVATLNSLQLKGPMEPAPTVVYTAMHGVGG